MDNDQYRPALFFFAVYAASWIPWSVAAYAGPEKGLEPYAPLFQFLGLLAPAAVALLFILASPSKALKRDFWDRLFNLRRIKSAYAVVAIVLPLTVILLSILLSLWFGQSADQFRLAGGGNLLAMIVLTMILAPVMEELGWHGYGVDSLRAKMGMLKATLLFGVLWCAWHAPLALIAGTYQHQLAAMGNPPYLANFFASVIPAAIIANWFYYKNNRSITGAILLHSMLNAASVLLAAGQAAKCIATLLYAVIAAILIATDPEFREGPRAFVGGATR